ncbi:hypothetical protein AB0M54_03855 [Actinoplanes sp. NPDC051470]|uniref:hypothetical protein n=1 Tax=unclassified Actinoplanes TaxID=2626549 RepID=UPI00343E5DD2
MRLSPRSIFVGVIALGLPFALTVGWVLGGHHLTSTPPATAGPGGSGLLGTAPARATDDSAPRWLPGRYENRPAAPAPSSAASAPAALALPVTPPSSGAETQAGPRGGPLTTLPTLPPLTDPPVPTPTMVTSEPPPPSATPSSSPSATPSGLGAGLLRRR